MSQWPTGVGAITLFVEDLAEAKDFYAKVFELQVLFEDADSTSFRFGNTIINLLKVEAAPELIDPAPVGGVEAAAAARSVFTVEVDDVNAKCAQLKALGVDLLNGPMDRPWGPRTASFRAPGGQIWEIAH